MEPVKQFQTVTEIPAEILHSVIWLLLEVAQGRIRTTRETLTAALVAAVGKHHQEEQPSNQHPPLADMAIPEEIM